MNYDFIINIFLIGRDKYWKNILNDDVEIMYYV